MSNVYGIYIEYCTIVKAKNKITLFKEPKKVLTAGEKGVFPFLYFKNKILKGICSILKLILQFMGLVHTI